MAVVLRVSIPPSSHSLRVSPLLCIGSIKSRTTTLVFVYFLNNWVSRRPGPNPREVHSNSFKRCQNKRRNYQYSRRLWIIQSNVRDVGPSSSSASSKIWASVDSIRLISFDVDVVLLTAGLHNPRTTHARTHQHKCTRSKQKRFIHKVRAFAAAAAAAVTAVNGEWGTSSERGLGVISFRPLATIHSACAAVCVHVGIAKLSRPTGKKKRRGRRKNS